MSWIVAIERDLSRAITVVDVGEVLQLIEERSQAEPPPMVDIACDRFLSFLYIFRRYTH
jgi:hypothetical protein